MITEFRGKRISAMLGVLPETVAHFDDEVSNYAFPERQTMRLKKIMGYNQHRLAKNTSTVSDFAAYGLQYILDNGWIGRDEIGALVVVTLCPDYFVPQISNIVQAQCDLDEDVICLDIAQGCCGFLIGVMQASMLLEHMKKKVILINGDVLSHKVSRRDRNDFPLIGDATAISVLENDKDAATIYYEMHMDGRRGGALKIPAGGFRIPSTDQTALLTDQGDGNFRSLNDLHMDGSAIFNFVQMEIPPLLATAFQRTGKALENFDYFFFHQPNRFMLEKLAVKVGLPMSRLPMNLVENFGNPSGASIPMTAIFNCRDALLDRENECCLSAFGSGLAWGVVMMKLGRLEHCEMIESNL